MWPSADVALAAVLATVQLTSAVPMGPTPPGAAEDTPTHAQVGNIHAQVGDTYAQVEDLAGTARVSSTATEIDVTINSNILFAKDSAVVQPGAKARLAEIGAQLRAAGPGSMRVVGYTDDLGSAEHGLELSRTRAAAVQVELSAATTAISVTVEGKGEADPVVPNTDEASRAKNRRVELHFTKK